eukprot:151751-Rhodomonas_salina.2
MLSESSSQDAGCLLFDGGTSSSPVNQYGCIFLSLGATSLGGAEQGRMSSLHSLQSNQYQQFLSQKVHEQLKGPTPSLDTTPQRTIRDPVLSSACAHSLVIGWAGAGRGRMEDERGAGVPLPGFGPGSGRHEAGGA